MRLLSEEKARWRLALQVLFLYMWLANLSGTDSRISVYMLCAVAGLLCLVGNHREKVPLSRGQQIGIGVFSFAFALATVMANYTLFEPVASLISMIDIGCSLIGGYVVGQNVLTYALNRLSFPVSPEGRNHPVQVFALVFVSIAAIDLMYLFFVLYPGVLTTDSFSTVAQITGQGAYNNTMPFWHTVTVEVFVKLGLWLFGDMTAAIATFHCAQILFMAACFGGVIVTLYQMGVPVPVLLAVYGIYGFMPYNVVYSVTLWKDIPFAGAAVLFITAFYRLLKNIGKHRWLNYLMFVIGALGFSLWRTNGWYAFLVTVIVMLFLLGRRQKKLLILMCIVLVFCWVLINPVLDALGVAETNLVEAFAIPMQQVARVMANERPLTEEETRLLSEIFWLDKVGQLYDPQTVDPIKFETFRYDRTGYIGENLWEYLTLYVKLGVKYPGDYLAAWIEETKGYWNGGYDYWVYTQKTGGTAYGIIPGEGNALISQLYASAFRLMEEPEIMKLFSSIGLHVWLLIGCCVINVLRKREEFLLTIPTLVLVLGLWMGTPVFCEFRYAYPVILSVPLIVWLTVFHRKEE